MMTDHTPSSKTYDPDRSRRIIIDAANNTGPCVFINLDPHCMSPDEILKLIDKWELHKIVRQIWGIPKKYSLRKFLETNERPWEDKDKTKGKK